MFKSRKKAFQASIDQAIITSYEVIGSKVRDIIKGETPVISGKLRDSTDFSLEDDGLYIFNTAEYAPYVEFGTMYQNANPFMRRGIVKSVPEIVKIISEQLGVDK